MIELAKQLARRFEGLRLKRYFCPAGVPTIGYGHVCSKDQPPITEEEAERLLSEDVSKSYNGAVRYCQKLKKESDNRKAAISDFVFNLGAGRWRSSTFRKKVEAGDWEGAAAECRKWVNGGGRRLPGLVLRREAEVAMMLNEEYRKNLS